MKKITTPLNSKRKRYSPQIKFQIVLEAIKGERSVGEIARFYQVHPTIIPRWKDFFLKNGHQIFDSEQKNKEEQGKIEKLEQLLGKKEVEIQLLKKFLGHYQSL